MAEPKDGTTGDYKVKQTSMAGINSLQLKIMDMKDVIQFNMERISTNIW